MARAAKLYRDAAQLSANALASVGVTRSICLRGEAAAGDAVFPFSGIELLAVVPEEVVGSGPKLAELYQRLRWVRRFNPWLKHLDVLGPSGLRSLAELDSFWASMERRTILPLTGERPSIPDVPVDPDDATACFGLWTEWHFPMALQQGGARKIRQAALEAWNAYAVAEALLKEPGLSSSEMEATLRQASPRMPTENLGQAGFAGSFVFALAQRLHETRLPPLLALGEPLIFEVTAAPLSLRRLFFVLPHAEHGLPEGASAKGAWACTPELLHLYIEYRNPFLYWSLPAELTRLGIEAPSAKRYLEACRYYGHERFLATPGFASAHPHGQALRLDYIEHTLAALQAGRSPAPMSEARVDETSGRADCMDYYRNSYDSLRARSIRLRDIVELINV